MYLNKENSRIKTSSPTHAALGPLWLFQDEQCWLSVSRQIIITLQHYFLHGHCQTSVIGPIWPISSLSVNPLVALPACNWSPICIRTIVFLCHWKYCQLCYFLESLHPTKASNVSLHDDSVLSCEKLCLLTQQYKICCFCNSLHFSVWDQKHKIPTGPAMSRNVCPTKCRRKCWNHLQLSVRKRTEWNVILGTFLHTLWAITTYWNM